MTTVNNTVTQKNVTIVRLFVLFVLVLLSSTKTFAETKKNEVVTTTSTQVSVSVSNEVVTVMASENGIAIMDVASWLMGENTTNSIKTNSINFGKKQLINAGVFTNSVLVRSLLKKVVCQGSSVA